MMHWASLLYSPPSVHIFIYSYVSPLHITNSVFPSRSCVQCLFSPRMSPELELHVPVPGSAAAGLTTRHPHPNFSCCPSPPSFPLPPNRSRQMAALPEPGSVGGFFFPWGFLVPSHCRWLLAYRESKGNWIVGWTVVELFLICSVITFCSNITCKVCTLPWKALWDNLCCKFALYK